MKPAAFAYERPASLDDALHLLSSRSGEAKIIAGGQSLVPMMNLRIARPELLVDINRLPGLDYHRLDPGGVLAVGALCRHTTLRESKLVAEVCPLMHAAYRSVAYGPVRNRGTLCGNLCHADPASEMPAVMLAVDASMVLKSRSGERTVAARDFFRGLYETAVRPDEMLVEVRIPVAPPRQGWGFQEVSVRQGDFAIVAVAALLQLEDGTVASAAIAIAGCAAHAWRPVAVEQGLVGQPPDDARFAKAAAACAATIGSQAGESDSDDPHGGSQYRRDLVQVLVGRALADARAKGV